MLPICCCSGATLQIHTQACRPWKSMAPFVSNRMPSQAPFYLKAMGSDLLGMKIAYGRGRAAFHWSFLGGSTVAIRAMPQQFAHFKKLYSPSASWLVSSQIASSAFTLGTIAVLPFYSLMVLAPNSNLTKQSMESNIPYVILGILYAYLLYLSWTPDTIRFMFASKYWLPELPGIAKMFSNEMTLASAWIHLLVVDLFAARQIFHDGLKNEIETRHSVSLCLLFCPIGILMHALTKVLTKKTNHAH